MTWLTDMIERAASTFVQAWLAAWIAVEDTTLDQLFDGKILTVGAVAAAMSIVKSLAARNVGSDSASLAD